MQKKLLGEIVLSIAGLQADKLVEILYKKKNVNEFLIAKKLDLTINQTRNILYKLADEGLVSFIRKKDPKKGGWYIYYWTLNSGKGLSKYKEKLENEIESLKNKISKKKNSMFFYCKNCGLEFSQENALIYDYTCHECGEPLEVKETASEVEALTKEIEKREKILNDVNIELEDVLSKEDKARVRKAKAAVKKKKEERDARRKKLAKERAKAAKKAGKPLKKAKASAKKKPKKKSKKKVVSKKKSVKKVKKTVKKAKKQGRKK